MNKIAYVMAEFPVLSETFISTEMRAMCHQGHSIIPFALQPSDSPYQAHDAILKEQTLYLHQYSNATALRGLGLLRPQWFKA